jgi:hypothetical protein
MNGDLMKKLFLMIAALLALASPGMAEDLNLTGVLKRTAQGQSAARF